MSGRPHGDSPDHRPHPPDTRTPTSRDPERYVQAIENSGLSIYDAVKVGDPNLWIPTEALERILDTALTGTSLADLALRTRSKSVKQLVCKALGYPVPASFRRTRPRFPGQLFDVFVQKSNNLQIWNEEIEAERRYVLVGVDPTDLVVRVRVLDGHALRQFDTTGTLTTKYQARYAPGAAPVELVTNDDSGVLPPIVRTEVDLASAVGPTSDPHANQLLSIEEVSRRLGSLVGSVFPDTGRDQERTRAAVLHQLVCRRLGYQAYHDDGRFPDVRHQLLEVKLQTSPTIDLGRASPDERHALDVPRLAGCSVRHCDVRYAVFGAQTDSHTVTLTHLTVTTGERFFERFPRFEGRITNRKLQVSLPEHILSAKE